jgi:selenocysteine lyase/cysteine desulfurase
MEAAPDAYFRYEYPSLLDDARGEIAALLRVRAGDVVFVPNATTAINTVFRNLVFGKGDVIVYFSTIYAACEKTIVYVCETTPAEARRIEVTYPVSDAYLVDQLTKTIRAAKAEGKTPRIAVFDTVASQPGVRMPFERLARACRDEGVLSCIDGAHAVGMLDPDVDLNLSELDPDFFFSNCHKCLIPPSAHIHR